MTAMRVVRPAAVDGLFYPADARTLTATVDELLHGVPDGRAGQQPIALVVPHAGYVYSGPVAATAYARLRHWAESITRVVVIGPNHRVPLNGLALSSADAWSTPLGEIAIDESANDLLLHCRGVVVDDEVHAPEHSIEVQLPFLQRVLGTGWGFVPIVAGAARAELVADALETVWATEGTLVVISSDLSHYHSHLVAQQLDMATASRIVSRRWEELDGDGACGAVPVRGALALARRHDDTVTLLDLRTSADTTGPADRVVGYGSFIVTGPS